ncbi:transcription elongation factor spt5 [Pleurotus pulmonarius]|nr:transcription elongation factor spt5 [Pleurotus pulmonarius]
MRSYQDILAFLDIEAGVEDSDDDGDEEDFDAPGFISNEPEIDGAEIEGGISIPSRDRGDSVLWNNDAESIVKDIMDRYRGCEGSAWKHQHATEQRTYIDGWKSAVAYLPSVTDGDIWKVAVTPGRELAVVTAIFNKVLALRIDGVDSAFCRERMPGVVYIEARDYGAVLNILKGINNVWPRYYKPEGGPIDLVPISERLALLTLDISPINEVEKAADQWQRFVRIRDRTRYRNQLAIIAGYVLDAREALVLVVPRADHWLRNPAMMHKKFQIMLLQTLFDDGSYWTDNMVSGYTVVTEAVTPWAERIVIKTGGQNNLRQKDAELRKVIPDNLALKSGERVIVIGTDAAGSTESMGLVGLVTDSPYALNEGVHLIAFTEPPGRYAYVSGFNLCRTGGPALWKGKLYA